MPPFSPLASGGIALGLLVVSAATVTAQEDTAAPQPPVEFAGHIACGPPVSSETSTQADGRREYRGGAWTPTVIEMSDPCLDGEVTISFDSDAYSLVGSGTYTLGTGTWRIENHEGAWEGSYSTVGFPDGTYDDGPTPLVGEGAYEGLVAVWATTYLGDDTCGSMSPSGGWDVRGIVSQAGLPEPPAAP